MDPKKALNIAAVALVFACYLICAFVMLSWNPLEWHWALRMLMGVWTLFVALAWMQKMDQ